MSPVKAYIQKLRRMTPEGRFLIAVELSDAVREVAMAGIRNRTGIKNKKLLYKKLEEIS